MKSGQENDTKKCCIYRGMAAAIKQVIIYHLTFIWWGRHNQNVPKCDRELALSITTYYNTYAITIKLQILRSHTFKCRLGVLSPGSFLHAIFCPKMKMFTFSRANSHASTNHKATDDHKYSPLPSADLDSSEVLISFSALS